MSPAQLINSGLANEILHDREQRLRVALATRELSTEDITLYAAHGAEVA